MFNLFLGLCNLIVTSCCCMPFDDMNANLSFLLFSFYLILPITHSISISIDGFDPDATNTICKGDATVLSRAVGVNTVDHQCPVVRPAVYDHDFVCLRNSSRFNPNEYFTFVIDTHSYSQNDSFIQDDSFNGDRVRSLSLATGYSTPPNSGKEQISLSKIMTLTITLVTVCFLLLLSRNMRMTYVIVLVTMCYIFIFCLIMAMFFIAKGRTFMRKKRTVNAAAEQVRANGRHIEVYREDFHSKKYLEPPMVCRREGWSGEGYGLDWFQKERWVLIA